LRQFQTVSRGNPAWAAHVAQSIDPSQPSTAGVAPGGTHARTFVTPFAFLFLLLPSLLDLGLPELTENSPITADESLSWQKFLRFFIGLKIGGHDRIAAALNDPALEMFAGMNARTFREACSQHSNSSLAAMQDACINNLIEQLHRQGIY